MSKYTTGDIARLTGVTVRTVQYYDSRGILVPSELSEGGRRLYSDDDVKRMRIICFLRGLGLSIDSIGQLFSEKDPGSVISLLLDQQEAVLKEEIGEREARLKSLSELKAGLKSLNDVTVESIGDIAFTMTGKRELKKIHMALLIGGIPLSALEVAAIILWTSRGIWQLFLLWAVIAVPWGVILSRWYFKKVAYICPRCHTVFRPSFKEAFFARHTPSTRRLTCTSCGHHGFCVETAAEPEAVSAER